MKGFVSKILTCAAMLNPSGGGNVTLKEVSTWLPGATQIPSPAKVESTSDWYLLDHLAAKLIQFDHVKNEFEPMLAESWSISGSTYTFKLRDKLKFSDGTPIRAEDVANSIKFLIAKRTSTHFPVWDFFGNHSRLTKFDDPFEDISVEDERTITFRLRERTQSFFLLLASPEGGIWQTADLERFAKSLQPKRFSGPYQLDSATEDQLLLIKNSNFGVPNWFADRPEKIRAYTGNLESTKNQMKSGKVDIYFEAGRPFAKHDYEPDDYRVAYSAPSTILYLFRVGAKSNLIGRDFVEAIWDGAANPEMIPANTFLPFTTRQGVDRERFLESMPKAVKEPRKIRIATLEKYFSDGLLHFIKERAAKSGYEFEYVKLSSKEWFEAFRKLGTDKYDFILSAYVASERFPSVQIRYLLEGYEIPFNLSPLDDPDWSRENSDLLKAVQAHMLQHQIVVPMFFVKNQIRYRSDIDIGDQPIMDADIQLWRLRGGLHGKR